jgi:hypothetical protein
MASSIPNNRFCVDYFKGKTLAAPVVFSAMTSTPKYDTLIKHIKANQR